MVLRSPHSKPFNRSAPFKCGVSFSLNTCSTVDQTLCPAFHGHAVLQGNFVTRIGRRLAYVLRSLYSEINLLPPSPHRIQLCMMKEEDWVRKRDQPISHLS